MKESIGVDFGDLDTFDCDCDFSWPLILLIEPGLFNNVYSRSEKGGKTNRSQTATDVVMVIK